MPRKLNVRPAIAAPCTGATGSAGATGGWSITGFAYYQTGPGTAGPLSIISNATTNARAAYRESAANINAAAVNVFWGYGFGGEPNPCTLRALVNGDASLAAGAGLEFATIRGGTGPYRDDHGEIARFYPPTGPDYWPRPSGITAAPAFPSLVRRVNFPPTTAEFFLPSFAAVAPGGDTVTVDHPAADGLVAGAAGVLPPPCTAAAQVVAHATTRDALAWDISTALPATDTPLSMNYDRRLVARPVELLAYGTPDPLDLGDLGYVKHAPRAVECLLTYREAYRERTLEQATTFSTQTTPKLHYFDLDNPTGSLTLAWLTGPRGVAAPTAPLPLEFQITAPFESSFFGDRDRLTATIPAPTAPGAYLLRLDGLALPYDRQPLGPTGLRETPAADLPPPCAMLYPLELAWVYDPTGPAAIVNSPPAFSTAPVTTLPVAVNEPILDGNVTNYYLPAYRFSRDGVEITSELMLRPAASKGAYTLLLDETAPGAYTLEPIPGVELTDLAGNANVAPWNRITWRTLATGAAVPAHAELEQFPKPLTTGPAALRLTFSEPVTGVSASVLQLTVDGQPRTASLTITGSGTDYRILNQSGTWPAGYAYWLELPTSAAITSRSREPLAAPARTAWVIDNSPPELPGVETYYAMPTDFIGPRHFAIAATAPAPTTGPASAGAVVSAPEGNATALTTSLSLFAGVGRGDPLTVPNCASGPGTVTVQALERPGRFARLAVSCPPPDAAQPPATGTYRPTAPRLPAPDGRHAIALPPPADLEQLTLTVSAEDYRANAYHVPGLELGKYRLAECWGLYLLNGTYTLDSHASSGRRLAPGFYQFAGGGGASMTIDAEEARPTGAWQLFHYPINEFNPAPYVGSAIGYGPLTAEIVDEFLAAGGESTPGGIVLESTREENFDYSLRWQITNTHTQAWAQLTRELPAGATRCGEPVARVGAVLVDVLLRGRYTVVATGRPVDRVWRLRNVGTNQGHYEIEGQPVYVPNEGAAVTQTSYKARHYGLSAILDPTAAAGFASGTPLVRRFPANTLPRSAGLIGSAATSDFYTDGTGDHHPNDYTTPPTGPTGEQSGADPASAGFPPAYWATLTLTGNP